MKKKYLIVAIISFIFIGCNQGKKRDKATNDSHSSEISLDWNGTYRGLLSCENCDGVLTTITLNNDKTFELDYFHLRGKKQNNSIEKGNFTFTKDGEKIILTLKDGSKTIYDVGENRLILSTKENEKNETKLTKNELQKISDKDIEFSDKPVKGLLTLGHEVSAFTPYNSSKYYWITGFGEQITKMYKEATSKATAPYTPVIAELVVKDKGKAKEGFAEDYDSILEIIEIKSIEPLTLKNYLE